MVRTAWLAICASVLLGCPQPRASDPPRSAPPPPAPSSPAADASAAFSIDAGIAAAPPPATPPAVTDVCTADSDCVLAMYPALATASAAGGNICCPRRCGRDVVTSSRAHAREVAYKAACGTVRCPPHDCAALSEPTPACRDQRCVPRR